MATMCIGLKLNRAKASQPTRSKTETLHTRLFPHLRNVQVIVRNSDWFIALFALFVPVVVVRVTTLVLVFWKSFDPCSIYRADSWSIAWLTGLGDLVSQTEICGHDLTVFCEAVSYSLSLKLFKLNSNWFETLQINLTSLMKMTSMPFKQTVQLSFHQLRTRTCSVWFPFFTLAPVLAQFWNAFNLLCTNTFLRQKSAQHPQLPILAIK